MIKRCLAVAAGLIAGRRIRLALECVLKIPRGSCGGAGRLAALLVGYRLLIEYAPSSRLAIHPAALAIPSRSIFKARSSSARCIGTSPRPPRRFNCAAAWESMTPPPSCRATDVTTFLAPARASSRDPRRTNPTGRPAQVFSRARPHGPLMPCPDSPVFSGRRTSHFSTGNITSITRSRPLAARYRASVSPPTQLSIRLIRAIFGRIRDRSFNPTPRSTSTPLIHALPSIRPAISGCPLARTGPASNSSSLIPPPANASRRPQRFTLSPTTAPSRRPIFFHTAATTTCSSTGARVVRAMTAPITSAWAGARLSPDPTWTTMA